MKYVTWRLHGHRTIIYLIFLFTEITENCLEQQIKAYEIIT